MINKFVKSNFSLLSLAFLLQPTMLISVYFDDLFDCNAGLNGIHFSRRDGALREKLLCFINSAQTSLKVVVYKLDDKEVINALIAARDRIISNGSLDITKDFCIIINPIKLINLSDPKTNREMILSFHRQMEQLTSINMFVYFGIKICTKDLVYKKNNIQGGLTHSKYVIVDDKYLLMGSLNFTKNAINHNCDSVFVTKNKSVIDDFKSNFEELLLDSQVLTDNSNAPKVQLMSRPTLTKEKIINSFSSAKNVCNALFSIPSSQKGNGESRKRSSTSPCSKSHSKLQFVIENNQDLGVYKQLAEDDQIEKIVVTLIKSATKSIYLAINSFTSQAICKALLEKSAEDLMKGHIHIISDLESTSSVSTLIKDNIVGVTGISSQIGSVLSVLANNGLRVHFLKPLQSTFSLMHHKFLVIDENIALLGSYNFTNGANVRNHEALMQTNDEDVVRRLVAEFKELKKKCSYTMRHCRTSEEVGYLATLTDTVPNSLISTPPSQSTPQRPTAHAKQTPSKRLPLNIGDTPERLGSARKKLESHTTLFELSDSSSNNSAN